MKNTPKRPAQLEEVFPLIRDCIEKGMYRQSRHALGRADERHIVLSDVLYVLKSGYHEKQKTSFDDTFQTWKYAIRGKTLDRLDIRIIVAFDDEGMMIITVMHVTRGQGFP
jgi:hypothetical protein